MQIKLIASDLDGTLLTTNKELSPKTRAAMDLAVGRGVYFVPATGRAFQAVPDIIKEYSGVEYVITSNGAAIYSISGKKRIYQCLLEERSVEAIMRLPRSENVIVEAFVDGVPYSETRYVRDARAFGATEFGAGYVLRTRTPVDDMQTFVMENKGKLDEIGLVCGDALEREKLKKLLADQVPGIYVTSSMPHLLEIGNSRAGKGKTLQQLMRILDISGEEAMAFGDEDNDCDMLSAVKYGIAMENGSPACRKAAYFITGTNEEDGVANAILRFLEQKG